MALHYDFTECSPETREAIKASNGGLLQCITFGMMFVGIGRLTEKSLPEFITRLRMYEQSLGCISSDDKLLTLELVEPFIGLRTNVSDMSIAAFHKHLTGILRRRAKDSLSRDERQKAEASGT